MANPTGFATWIQYILLDEGPEVNVNPDEPGGASKYGVSVSAMTDYNKSLNLPAATIGDITILTAAQATAFYAWYYSPMMLDQVPAQIAYRIADLVGTLGRTGSIKALQMCLAIWPLTGIMDVATLAAVEAATPAVLILQLDGAWLVWKFKDGGPKGWAEYGHGWINRVLKVRARLPALMGV